MAINLIPLESPFIFLLNGSMFARSICFCGMISKAECVGSANEKFAKSPLPEFNS